MGAVELILSKESGLQRGTFPQHEIAHDLKDDFALCTFL